MAKYVRCGIEMGIPKMFVKSNKVINFIAHRWYKDGEACELIACLMSYSDETYTLTDMTGRNTIVVRPTFKRVEVDISYRNSTYYEKIQYLVAERKGEQYWDVYEIVKRKSDNDLSIFKGRVMRV